MTTFSKFIFVRNLLDRWYDFILVDPTSEMKYERCKKARAKIEKIEDQSFRHECIQELTFLEDLYLGEMLHQTAIETAKLDMKRNKGSVAQR